MHGGFREYEGPCTLARLTGGFTFSRTRHGIFALDNLSATKRPTGPAPQMITLGVSSTVMLTIDEEGASVWKYIL
jgi:hypothetical protein